MYFSKKPSIYEIFLILIFISLWLMPVMLSLLLSLFDYRFSFVGEEWQLINRSIVAKSAGIAAISAIFGATLVFLITTKTKEAQPFAQNEPLDLLQKSILFIILILSGYGTFKSFGGTIFERPYGGPGSAWLGYGAWSVTYLIVLSLLVFDYMRMRRMSVAIIFMSTLAFMPFLLSGSRIDFLSFMLALSIYISARYDLKFRFLWAAATIVWAILIIMPLAYLRSVMHTMTIDRTTISEVAPRISSRYLSFISDDMIYLSTIGDLGASVFQVIGYIQAGIEQIGVGRALVSYSIRMLPGPIFPNRPADFSSTFPENIGGGALHSLGEGYLISGYLGCAIIGLFMGILITYATLSEGRHCAGYMPISSIIFLFPWLLLIRGGWYQFFSILKSVEILLLLLLVLYVTRIVQKKISL
jgi:hypothetical protein